MATRDDDEDLLNAIIVRSNHMHGLGDRLVSPKARAAVAGSPRAAAARSSKSIVDFGQSPALPFVRRTPRGSGKALQARLISVEVCAGAGGQALGLEAAGFDHQALVEIDAACCATLKLNRPEWNVLQTDLRSVSGKDWKGIDLFAGGLPCPPFSVAGKQLGDRDERNLFPTAISIIDEMRPRAVMIENVRGFLDPKFRTYRDDFRRQLRSLGYDVIWELFNAAQFGVSQLRPRVAIVAMRDGLLSEFEWPKATGTAPASVGDLLYDLMKEREWRGASAWRKKASGIAPTIVGGSHKHGGPDLGPTRAKKAWAELGVDGMGIADAPPTRDFNGSPRLTVRMVARIQGFPDAWQFSGRKTAAYRQVGNAFPPPFAQAVAENISSVLRTRRVYRVA